MHLADASAMFQSVLSHTYWLDMKRTMQGIKGASLTPST